MSDWDLYFFADGASLDDGSPVEKGLRRMGIDMAKIIFNHLEHFTGSGREASRLMRALLRRISSTYPSLIQRLGAGNCLV